MTVWPRIKKTAPQRPRKSAIADLVLIALVGGPLAAPFLASTSLPLLPLIANIIYFMGDRVCPQPEMGLALSPPHIMAVCMRCYGTLLGLVAMRWLIGRSSGREAYWLNQYGIAGFCLTVLLCLAYPAELWAQSWGWWGYDNAIVTGFGWIAGLGLGAYIMPLLHPNPAGRIVEG
ncbi:DUF2085 domain-containing protein [Altericista sp. CCNU0014]|uniref:DUF2085 domain-containing protein n=1 Tax=Altericista sp. CCNU0014 TaxID=3082949 RepID=UPI00384FF180